MCMLLNCRALTSDFLPCVKTTKQAGNNQVDLQLFSAGLDLSAGYLRSKRPSAASLPSAASNLWQSASVGTGSAVNR